MGIPTIEEFKAIAYALKSYSGDNPDRKNFITLINRMVDDPDFTALENADKILMGACAFELGKIEREYLLRSPENSELYKKLKSGLKITKQNPLSHKDRIIALSAFFNYIKSQAPDMLVADTTWVKKIALQNQTLDVIKTVLGKLQNEIHCIVTTQPFFSPLKENLADMQGQYAKTATKGWLYNTGTAHIPHAKFIDLISEYCDTFFSPVSEENLQPELKVLEAYMLRMGSAVFVMRALEAECKLTSRPGSKLYDICARALNINHTKDINLDDRIDWLKMLDRNINNMTENLKDFLDEKEKTDYPGIRKELQRIQGMIAQYVAEYYAEKNAPSRIEGGAVLATSIAAQRGMQSAYSNMIGGSIPTPGALMMDTAAGAAGSLAGPGGSFVAVALSRFIRSYVVPFAVAGICASVMDSAGTQVGNLAVKPFSYTARKFKSLISWCMSVELDKTELRKDTELLEALVTLPDDVFPAESKKKIENTTGIRSRLAM